MRKLGKVKVSPCLQHANDTSLEVLWPHRMQCDHHHAVAAVIHKPLPEWKMTP